MNNAAHVATGGEVSDHQRQEAPSIAKLGYQWRLVQMAKVLKLEIYSVIFQILAVMDVSIMASWRASIFCLHLLVKKWRARSLPDVAISVSKIRSNIAENRKRN